MAGKTDTSATLFAQKKLLGKAHTSNLKIDGEEVIGSNIQTSTDLIFGDPVPNSPSLSLYSVQSASLGSNPSVEYIQFVLNVLTGTTYDANDPGAGGGTDTGEGSQTSGPHTYKFRLPSNYESLTDNPNAGNGVFNNDRLVHETLGRLQLVPPFFSQTAPNPYIVKIYKDNGSGGVGEEIPLLDNIDWNVDFYNGILFIQDYNPTKIPAFARAFAYVGRMAEDVIVKTESPLQQGAVLFGGSTGKISQNIDKIFWDNFQERLGVGTSQPGSTLTVRGSSRTIGELSVTGSLVVTGSAAPGANSTYSLGLIDNRWKSLFAESGSFSGPVTIEGDLTVLGTQTVISSTIVDIGDNIIVLNSVSTPQRFGGLYVIDQDTNQTGSLIWDSLNDRWLSGIKDSEISLVSGSGINNRVARWIGTNGVSHGIIYDDGVNVGIGTDAGVDRLTVDGEVSVTGSIRPGITKTYNFGSLDKAWKNVYSSTGSFGDLYADGSLFVSGNSYLTGSVFANSDFSVSGSSYLTGSIFAQSNIFVSGSSYLTGSIFANSDVFVSGSITVTGSTLVHGVFTAENDVHITGTLYGDDHLQVGDDIVPEFDKTFSIGSATNLWKNVYSSTGSFGDLYADGNLSVSGSSYLTGSLTLLSDAFISGSATLLSDAWINGDIYTSGSLEVSGNIIVTGSTTLLSDTWSIGNIHTSGSIDISGSTTVTGSLFLASDAWIEGNLYTSGSAEISGSAFVSGSFTLLSDAWLGGDIYSSGSIDVSGSVLVTGSLTTKDTLTVTKDLIVSGVVYGDETIKVGNSVIPQGDINFVLGDPLNRWKDVLSLSFSGSLTALSDGTPYIVDGGNMSVVTASNGSIILSTINSGTIHGVTPGTGLLGGGTSGTVSLGIDDSIVATVSGATFSGAVNFISGLSGSLTRLSDGVTPYLTAGNKILLSTGSNGSVTISLSPDAASVAGSNKQIQFNDNGALGGSENLIFDKSKGALTGAYIVASQGLSGSLTTLSNGDPFIIAGAGITVTTGSSGALTISSDATGITGLTIGPAEDGTYEDGLFTDFTPSTPIGTPIDRFNEVLLALAPPPAPNMRNISSENSSGVSAYLSFGASNDRSGFSPYYYSSNVAAGFDAVDVNGLYGPATSGNNIRKGVYGSFSIINGTLNNNVPAHVYNTGVTNYTAKSFGNGNAGTVRLYVNGNIVHSLNLNQDVGMGPPGSGTGTSLNGNGSGFIQLSQTGSAYQSNTVEFSPFQHRTGRYQVGTADQRRGWNYARVVHVVGSNQYQTNYVEWIVDTDNNSVSAPESAMTFEGSGSLKLSGVEYYTSASLSYSVTVNNAYKYVYDLNNITFTTNTTSDAAAAVSLSFPSQAKPTINLSAGENHEKSLSLSTSTELHADYLINGRIEVGVNVTHPLKTSLTNGGKASKSQIILYNLSNTSTELVETFRRENYRLLSGSYDTQASVTDTANSWDSSVHMLSTIGYSDGLQFYNQLLVSPKRALNGGNFSTLSCGPSGNPNYSSVSGTRTFFRWFKNTTGSSKYDLVLTVNGMGTIDQSSSVLSTSNLKISVKVPGKTGWLDVATPYSHGSNLIDGNGTHISNSYIPFVGTLNAINYLTLGTLAVDPNEFIVVKIEAGSSWTGNVSLMTVSFGAGTGTLTPVPDLNEIDSDNSGISALLSFGSSKTISGYSNSSTESGFSPVDLNGLYQISTSGNNLRRGIFTTVTNIEGDLNESVSSPGLDYVNNAFSDSNRGTLRLEVNGSTIHTIDLSSNVGSGNPGSGTGTDTNSNGSGFISISSWSPGLYDNGVPGYTEIQRTARYRVTPADQRNGWNYLRVVHAIDNVDRTTNYVEWVNVVDSVPLTSSDNSLSNFGDDTFSYISGVKYFNAPSGSLQTKVAGIYRNIYTNSNSAISFTSLSNATASRIIQSGLGLISTKTTNSSTDSLQSLNTNMNSQNEVLTVTGFLKFNRSKSLPGTWTTAYGCAGAMVFQHPYKASLTTPVQSTTNLLVWTPVDISNANTDEHFTGEAYRLVDSTYTTQGVISSRSWNSWTTMNDPVNYPDHSTGLLVYDTYLMSPKNGGTNGDFRNRSEGGSLESPGGNVDYSNLTNSTRTYFRSFLNNTTNDRPSIKITLYGDAKIVAKNGPNAGTLGANKNIYVHVGIPGQTELLDLARPSSGTGTFSEDSGCLSGTLTSTVTSGGVTNICFFNGANVNGTASGAKRILLRITASKDWTGYLDRISISWS